MLLSNQTALGAKTMITEQKISNFVDSLTYQDKERILNNLLYLIVGENSKQTTMDDVRLSVLQELFESRSNFREDD